MDDCIIEGVDTVISDEEVVLNWSTKMNRKVLNSLSVCENDKVLETFLKDYVRIIQQQARNCKVKNLLAEKIIEHLRVFYLCCITVSNTPLDMQNFWDSIEDVLIVLCNLVLQSLRQLKGESGKEYREKILEITKIIINTLTLNLLNNHTRICHVLLKLNVKSDSKAFKDVMRGVYRHFLVMIPIKENTADTFCRHYLLFQHYKEISTKENRTKMDQVLYGRFNIKSDSEKNKILTNILLPQGSSIVDCVDLLTNSRENAIDKYFKYLDKKTNDDLVLSINLDSDSEDDGSSSTGQEDPLQQYTNDVKIENESNESRSYFSEFIICVDDSDSDVEEILVPIISRNTSKSSNVIQHPIPTSFLDSIKIPDDTLEGTSIISNELKAKEVESFCNITSAPSPLPVIQLYLNDYKDQILDEVPCDQSNNLVAPITDDPSVVHIPDASVTPIDANRSSSSPTIQKTSEHINDVENNKQCETELSKTEKSMQISTNSDFNFMSGLITPPVSDRANDDVNSDLNHVNNGSKNVYVPNIISYSYESEMETSVNNGASVENDVSNEISHNSDAKNCTRNENDKSEVNLETETNLSAQIEHLKLNIVPTQEVPEVQCTLNELEELEITHMDDSNIEENCSETFSENEEQLNTDLMPIDMILDDCQLPTSEIKENILNRSERLTTSGLHSENINNKLRLTGKSILPAVSNINYNSLNKIIEITNTSQKSSDPINMEENLVPEDMVLEDYEHLSEVRETNLNNQSLVSLPKSIGFEKNADNEINKLQKNNQETIAAEVSYGSVNKVVDCINTSRNSTYTSNCKIQASVNMGDFINGANANISAKLNENKVNKILKTKPRGILYKPDKVIYTSSERVSAPLSVFSKFEQAQSELQTAFSGPVDSMYSYSNMSSDHSNSNDSIHSFTYFQPQSKIKTTEHPKEADSPTSPPYEQIQAQDYENHIMSVDYNNYISTVCKIDKIPNDLEMNGTVHSPKEINVPSEFISNRKRKLNVDANPQKKGKVNFGHVEVRLIPRIDNKLIEEDVLVEASESMEEYKITADDSKLVYLQPQIPIKIETISELQEKERQLKIRGLLQNEKIGTNENSCIVKRIDFDKYPSPVNPLGSNFGYKIQNLINSDSKETRRINSVPSGYIPPVNGYSSVHGLQSNNAMEQQQTFNNQQNQTSSTFNNNCNSEILNLSVSSTIVSEFDSPESEFSRSPKLLQNSDQIVQQCIIENLDNNTETELITSVHSNIALLSNNSNFYSTVHEQKLPNAVIPPSEDLSCHQQSVNSTDNLDKYCNNLDELLLKNELDKLVNCESEYSLPLKKRRVIPKLNETAPPFKEEISYPATPMISIAEIEALHQNTAKNTRCFKTPAERKEMPPIPFVYNKNSSEPTPIITDQFNINNHTYNNPTINYHMNSMPLPFINVPCPPYYSFPPFIVPFNNVATYDGNLNQESTTVIKKEEPPRVAKTVKAQKKEKKKQFSSKTKEYEQFVPDKKVFF